MMRTLLSFVAAFLSILSCEAFSATTAAKSSQVASQNAFTFPTSPSGTVARKQDDSGTLLNFIVSEKSSPAAGRSATISKQGPSHAAIMDLGVSSPSGVAAASAPEVLETSSKQKMSPFAALLDLTVTSLADTTGSPPPPPKAVETTPNQEESTQEVPVSLGASASTDIAAAELVAEEKLFAEEAEEKRLDEEARLAVPPELVETTVKQEESAHAAIMDVGATSPSDGKNVAVSHVLPATSSPRRHRFMRPDQWWDSPSPRRNSVAAVGHVTHNADAQLRPAATRKLSQSQPRGRYVAPSHQRWDSSTGNRDHFSTIVGGAHHRSGNAKEQRQPSRRKLPDQRARHPATQPDPSGAWWDAPYPSSSKPLANSRFGGTDPF